MMRCLPLLFLIFFLHNNAAFAQSAAASEWQDGHISMGAKATNASPLENSYDVKYVKIELAMTNLSTAISGNSITRALVTNAAGLNQYAFELDTALTIDSMRLNGQLVAPAASLGYLRTVVLSASLASGAAITAQVWYHGTPPNGTGFFTSGVNHNVLASGTNITFTLSDPYLSKDWWPCKQALQDKIDSADIWITVPAGLRTGCNGLLQNITPVAGGSRFEWKTRYPIDYYLISASVAPYTDYTRIMHFSGSSDSMPVVHYLYDTATIRPAFQSALDSTGLVVDYLSALYGRYPFWKEKYGHCFAPLGGGMEHQTMTTLGVYDMPLVSHELGHQWWGDAVTYSSWKDIWLSEGWASYTEQLFVEHFRGVAAAQAYRTTVYNRVIAQAGGTVVLADVDTNNVYRIFDSRLTYDKGAAVAHMLRYVAPNDAAFFAGLQSYQSAYQFGTATTADFRQKMEAAYGQPLDTFFNQWIIGEGYPTFAATWNQSGSTVFIRLTQTVSKPLIVPLFYTPLDIKLSSATGDTVVRIYANAATQMLQFTWPRAITGLTIDPTNQILNKTGAIQKDPALSVQETLPHNSLHIAPNPAKDGWKITGLAAGAQLKLMDISGKVIWQQIALQDSLTIPAAALPSGVYQLEVVNKGAKYAIQQLQKL